MRRWVLAFALIGCGDVNKVTDAGLPDAYQPDGANAPMCATGETVCNGATCADTMTDEFNCGACNNQCAPTQACVSGTCMPITSCKDVRDFDPSAPDGMYVLATGATMYCDFTDNLAISDFRLDVFTAAPPGYGLVRATDLMKPSFGAAFISWFNLRGGVQAFSTFNAGNCCVSTVLGQRLQLGGLFTFVAAPSTTSCAFSYTANTTYSLSRMQSGGFVSSLPADFFTQFPPTEGAGCSDGTNPAFYFKAGPIN